MNEGAEARKDREQRERQEEVQNQMKMSRTGVPDDIVIVTIAYDLKNGNVQVAGPISNKQMMYGMLEMARDCVVDYNRQNIPGVQTP